MRVRARACVLLHVRRIDRCEKRAVAAVRGALDDLCQSGAMMLLMLPMLLLLVLVVRGVVRACSACACVLACARACVQACAWVSRKELLQNVRAISKQFV